MRNTLRYIIPPKYYNPYKSYKNNIIIQLKNSVIQVYYSYHFLNNSTNSLGLMLKNILSAALIKNSDLDYLKPYFSGINKSKSRVFHQVHHQYLIFLFCFIICIKIKLNRYNITPYSN